MSRPVRFLNVDLEVGARTRAQLAPLLDALEGRCLELFRGRIRGLYRVHFESRRSHRNATAALRDLLGVVERLKPPARGAWAAATMRDFNIGVELARGVRSVELVIDPDATRRLVGVGGRLAITVYPAATAARTPRRAAAASR